MKTNLAEYRNDWYMPGNPVKRLLWYYTSLLFFQSYWLPFSPLKVLLLRAFGAKVGKGVLLKPHVTIKYPWRLTIGNYCWIGERVWIDNLAPITIKSHVCLSQGAYLLTGNHDYSLASFDLIVKSIVLEEGVWIGAKAIVCPGVQCQSHAVLTAGSVATKVLEAYSVYQGNPAQLVKERRIQYRPQS